MTFSKQTEALPGKTGQRKRKKQMKKTMMNMVGETKVERWFDGDAPASVEGATVLGYSKDGRLERALYELKNGDFCSINNGVGTFVRRQTFPQFMIDEDCPWKFTDAQFKRRKKLMLKIKKENSESGYDALKAWVDRQKKLSGEFMAELLTLFFKEATKTNPPDIEAGDKCVLKAIDEQVDAMEHGGSCHKVARYLIGDSHR